MAMILACPVLAVGCGTGNMTKWIAKQVGDNGNVTAVDISHEQVKIAEQNYTTGTKN